MSAHEHGPGCHELASRLSDYLDHDVDPALCAEIERHLDDCPPCRDFLESLRRTVGLLRGAPSSGVLPGELRRKIVEAYRKAEQGEKP